MSFYAFLGLSYTASHLVPFLQEQGLSLCWTSRSADKITQPCNHVQGTLWGDSLPDHVTHILLSSPPDKAGLDPFLQQYGHNAFPSLQWIGYMSTTGVYGDCKGQWIDETTLPAPVSDVSVARLKAENAITAWAESRRIDCVIFRLSGIYGRGRNTLEALKDETARHIIKDGQVFNRIHVEDIARFINHVMKHSLSGVWNVSDDEPAPNSVVLQYGASLLGCDVPIAVDYDTIKDTLSPAMRRFYSENKRVSNQKMKETLGSELLYPTYREGLSHLNIINQTSFA